MEQKRIKITRANGWYKQLVGTTFTVIAESLSNYIVLTNGDIEFWVDKNDCIVVESPEKLSIKVKLIPNYDGDTVDFPVKLPQGDWIDLRACISVHRLPVSKGTKICVPLGVAMELPQGYEAHILPRSSIYKKGLLLCNSQGIIDGSYKGDNDQWKAWFYATEECEIEFNERICQFRIEKIQPELEIIEVDFLNNPDRSGFGEGTKLIK